MGPMSRAHARDRECPWVREILGISQISSRPAFGAVTVELSYWVRAIQSPDFARDGLDRPAIPPLAPWLKYPFPPCEVP